MLFVIIVLIIILIILSIITGNKESKTIIDNTKQYEDIIKKIDNKESFNLLITNGTNKLQSVFDYYEKVYSLKYESITKNEANDSYRKLIKKFDFLINEDVDRVFVVIDKGEPSGILVGAFKEKNLKEVLIANNIISSEYSDIDEIMGDDLNAYNNGTVYNILYTDGSTKLYEYRKTFVNNKIKSLLLYRDNLNQQTAAEQIDAKLNMGNELDSKLPMLIKYKDGEILKTVPNITVDNLVTECNN